MSREGWHQTVADPARPPLEDESAHLALRLLRELVNRPQRLPEPFGLIAVLGVENLLGRPCMQHAREERLRDGIVELARDSPALFQSALRLAPPRLDELCGRAFAFAD